MCSIGAIWGFIWELLIFFLGAILGISVRPYHDDASTRNGRDRRRCNLINNQKGDSNCFICQHSPRLQILLYLPIPDLLIFDQTIYTISVNLFSVTSWRNETHEKEDIHGGL